MISGDQQTVEIEFEPTANVSMGQLDIEAADDLLFIKFADQTIFKKSFNDARLLSESLSAKFMKTHRKLVIKYKVA